MSEVPTAYSESTAIELVRKEGTARSFKSISASNVAGIIVKQVSGGVLPTLGTEDPQVVAGVLLYPAASGPRAVTIRGKVRAFWDGLSSGGTTYPGQEIQLSYTNSGWFTGGNASGAWSAIGTYVGTPGTSTALGATNSGLLQVVELY